MLSITSLWLAILVSAIVVWAASAIIWMVLPHHKSDFKALPDEDSVRNALAPQNVEPGLYDIPHMKSWEEIKEEQSIKKFEDGPVAYLTVLPKGVPAMGGNMVLSFIFNLLVSFIVAYILTRSLSPGADYLAVFRLAGVTSWLAYSFALIPEGVWFSRPWGNIAKFVFDGLIYALLTAGIFGWLWPH